MKTLVEIAGIVVMSGMWFLLGRLTSDVKSVKRAAGIGFSRGWEARGEEAGEEMRETLDMIFEEFEIEEEEAIQAMGIIAARLECKRVEVKRLEGMML
jgi:hypothetical protein